MVAGGGMESDAHTRRPKPGILFALTFAWSWAFLLPAVAAGMSADTFPVPVLRALAGIGPLVSALVLVYLTLDRNGTYRTFRDTLKNSTFQQVFSSVPVSSGTWTLNNGRIVFHCTSTSQPERLNKDHPFQVRSVTQSDLIFIDYAGNVGKAVKLK